MKDFVCKIQIQTINILWYRIKKYYVYILTHNNKFIKKLEFVKLTDILIRAFEPICKMYQSFSEEYQHLLPKRLSPPVSTTTYNT